jgi:hypothetical protein
MPYDGDIHNGIASPVVGKILEVAATTSTFRSVAAEKMDVEQMVYADQYNMGRELCGETFQEGDLVLMKDHSPLSRGEVRKFKRFHWVGPFTVTSRPRPGVYMLKWRDSGKIWKSSIAQVELKAYLGDEEVITRNRNTWPTQQPTQESRTHQMLTQYRDGRKPPQPTQKKL